jgi:protein-S-isoprenylcysteine O-methyltransferase Ste14
MSEQELFNGIILTWLVLAAVVFVLLFFVTAPYGRHRRKGWGPTIDNKAGWIIMESTSSILFALFFILGNRHGSIVALVFLAMWEAHYIHRAFIYPLTLRGTGKRMPVFVVFLGFFFNSVNSYLNGRYLFSISPVYEISWLHDPRFIVGTALFIAGFMVNRHSDRILRGLRRNDDDGYKIPYGGFYLWVSSPNYLGELAIWFGFAIATWSLAGLTFAIWTAANLVPRARANHVWYKAKFIDYPQERRILIPRFW